MINLKKFKPFGPYNVGFESMPGGKRITKDNLKNFWETDSLKKIRFSKGVYIFGMQITSGILPCYVGKTNNNFERECFTERNLYIYNGEIIRYERKYKPFIFFLVYQQQKKQKISDRVIRELENYVINLAVDINPDLANIRGLESEDRFEISDLGAGRGTGAPTRAGSFFRKMLY